MNYLNRLHEVEIEILDEIVRICKIHKITYYLGYGTLLGAVRHHGFIPWDDDIDITMPRKDYERFIELAPNELAKEYVLQSYKTDNEYVRRFAKVRKLNTVFIEASNPDELGNYLGLFVDIWPLDFAKHDKGFQNVQKYLLYKIEAMLLIKQRKTKRGVKLIICQLLSYRFLQNIQQFIMKIVKSGEYIVNLASPYSAKRETYPSSFYYPPDKLEFEGKFYCVPSKYHEVLKTIYGDYMALPPIEKRIAHSPIRLNFDTSGPDEII